MTYLTHEEKTKMLLSVDSRVEGAQSKLFDVYKKTCGGTLVRAWKLAKSRIDISAQYTKYDLFEEIKRQFYPALAELSQNLALQDWAELSVKFDFAIDDLYDYNYTGGWES